MLSKFHQMTSSATLASLISALSFSLSSQPAREPQAFSGEAFAVPVEAETVALRAADIAPAVPARTGRLSSGVVRLAWAA